MRLDPAKYIVWTSTEGNLLYGDCLAHVVCVGKDRTLCGKLKGRMTTRYTTFDPTRDCKRCAAALAKETVKA